MKYENLLNEIWRDVVGFEGIYFVSNKERFRRGDKIRLGTMSQGYREVSLGKYKRERFHVLVAKAFPEICGEWFEGAVVHHKDFNRLNNVPENLVVLTHSEHSKLHYEFLPDSYKKPSEKRNKSISVALKGIEYRTKWKPILQLTLDGELVKEWEKIEQVKEAGYSPGNVCWACKGKLKTAYGFKWQYK